MSTEPTEDYGRGNTRSESTTWEWRHVRVTRGAAGSINSRPKGVRWRRLPRLPRSRPLTLRVLYRGGSQAWIVVTARGETNALPGDMALIDVVRAIGQW